MISGIQGKETQGVCYNPGSSNPKLLRESALGLSFVICKLEAVHPRSPPPI